MTKREKKNRRYREKFIAVVEIRCPCGQLAFKTKSAAMSALRRARMQADRDDLDVYPCHEYAVYHIGQPEHAEHAKP